MSLFRVDSSIRQEGSVSRAVADTVTANWQAAHPTGEIARRDLATTPVPTDAWTDSIAGNYAGDARTPAQQQAKDLATELADELVAAESIVIGTSLYNFGVSQHLKSWIDLLLTDPRFAPGQRPLTGKTVALVIARGGGYGPGTPRDGWDHATPWLVRIFQDVLGAELTTVAAELTLAEVTPAMAELVPLAKQSQAAAHELAATTGKAFATRQTASV
ncbi:NAD(P)H-dependent oxidoreductase [Actinokineospora sp. NBRC 105648]|uniref:FMN-dependent NADH-azoreductase n=1 Tax=Actinokineospora sp. NBRC 105648 TaxID=3032206 RepID=UPI0024A1397B|nr:NAD(P)H-dependent oxidoreductase [Actinokineospora sp. NBRC 105648]GLZ36757.1 FMN-dependent NADH-azoreductase [Actinokineospora sp. NBRC 105648]